MGKFRVTYEIVTHESAEHGDAESRGYVQPGEWRTDDAGDGLTLREAMRLAAPQEDSGRWWSEVDGRQNYTTGAVETRSIHPPRNITPSSYARVSRVLGFNRGA